MTLSLSLLATYAHAVAAVLLVGYALFWVVMTTTIREKEGDESARLFRLIQQSRWPPGVVPRRLRLSFPALGWAFLLALVLSGAILLVSGGWTWDAWLSRGWPVTKLALIALLVLGHASATMRPRRWLAYVNGGLVLLIVIVSALLRH